MIAEATRLQAALQSDALDWLLPDWPAPANVGALCTTRLGGVSAAPYASMNLGLHTADAAQHVQQNRERLVRVTTRPVQFVSQVHGVMVAPESATISAPCAADAQVAHHREHAIAVLSADCLPVLLCDDGGTVVMAAHAGWRGLAAGVLENTVAAAAVAPETLMAWLGPAIGPAVFEVGPEVRAAFVSAQPEAASAFTFGQGDRFFADIFQLARLRFARAGVMRVYGGNLCTYSHPERFFSHRRAPVTGRMAAVIWRT